MRVLLVGLPGSGVTTVGGLLAQRLGWPFLDDDALLERTGSAGGALTLLLGVPGDLVAGVPDELVEDDLARQRLAGDGNHLVWLKCSSPVLTRRVQSRFGGRAEEEVRRLAAARNPLYESLAAQVVDTAANPAGAAANLVIDALRAEA